MIRRLTAGWRMATHQGRLSSAVIFTTMSVVLFLATGAALDYARLTSMRGGIDLAVKSAAAAAAEKLRSGQAADDEIEAVALSQFDKTSAFARQVGTIEAPTISIDRAAQSVTVGTSGTVMMTVSRFRGIDKVVVPASSIASWAPLTADAQP